MKPTHVRRRYAVTVAGMAWEQREDVPIESHVQDYWTEAQVRVFWKTIETFQKKERTLLSLKGLGLL